MRNTLLPAFCILYISSTAQLGKGQEFSHGDINLRLASTQRAQVVGTDYDVKCYRLWLRINPDTAIGVYVKGNVTTLFTTQQNNFSTIRFDFVSQLIVDSVKYHNGKLSTSNYTEIGDVLNITIPSIASSGTLDSITVYYRGVPPPAPWSTGFIRSTHAGLNYIYTLSEPYSASSWWPCKTDVTDKADSVDMIISTPPGFKAAGNGTLVSETSNASGVRTVWKHRYPIPAYLVATAVANYQVYNSGTVNIGGKSMPVYHYFFPETNTASVRAEVDRTNDMLTAFSTWFGDYPFKNEKYGHYEFGFSGGMEHSTFSGMSGSAFTWDIIAHELGHQWFGDGTTCASWNDIWINEGFAQFTELIAAEKIPALNSRLAGHRSTIKTNALAYNSETTYRTDVSSLVTIFSPSTYIYERGAMILNMLRLTLGDAKFFQAIQNYTSDPALKYRNAATADVRRHMEAVSGLNLANFFNNWVYTPGHATYNVQWGKNVNYIQLQLIQSRTAGSTAPYFDMPIPIRIRGSLASQDTTVIIFDRNGVMNYDNNGVLTSTGDNRIAYHLSFDPVTVSFDPSNLTLATGTVSFLRLLDVQELELKGTKEDQLVQLKWKASWTGNISGMNLQKSNDGIHFNTILTVPSSQLKSGQSFEYSDRISGKKNLYRIQLDFSGAMKYSNIIKFEAAEKSFSISPNPASDNLVINMHAVSGSEKVSVQVYDAQGRTYAQYFALANENQKINVKNWTNGLYLVEVSYGKTSERFKLLVQH